MKEGVVFMDIEQVLRDQVTWSHANKIRRSNDRKVKRTPRSDDAQEGSTITYEFLRPLSYSVN